MRAAVTAPFETERGGQEHRGIRGVAQRAARWFAAHVRQILYVACLIGATVRVSLAGGALSWVLFYAALLVLPVSLVYAAYVHFSLKLYQELQTPRVLKGATAPYRLVVENTLPFPVNDVELRTETRVGETDAVADGERISLAGGEKRTFTGGCICRYVGTYPIGVLTLEVADCFRLITYRFRVPAEFRAVVTPRITDAAARMIDFDDLKNSRRFKRPKDYEETSGADVRAFHTGDRISRMHWRASARGQGLFVRLPEEKDARPVTLLLLASPAPRTLEEIRRRDFFMEFVVSAAYRFAERRETLIVYYPKGGVRRFVVSAPDSFRDFYVEIEDGVYTAADQQEDFAEEARGMLSAEEASLVLCVREEAAGTEGFLEVPEGTDGRGGWA